MLFTCGFKNDKQSIGNYKKQITAQAGATHFLTFRESSMAFDGNFELLVMKDSFCALIIHIRDSSTNFLTTVPVGILIKNKAVAQTFYKLFEDIENDDEAFFGLLNPKR